MRPISALIYPKQAKNCLLTFLIWQTVEQSIITLVIKKIGIDLFFLCTEDVNTKSYMKITFAYFYKKPTAGLKKPQMN